MAFADDGMAVHHGALMPEDLMGDVRLLETDSCASVFVAAVGTPSKTSAAWLLGGALATQRTAFYYSVGR